MEDGPILNAAVSRYPRLSRLWIDTSHMRFLLHAGCWGSCLGYVSASVRRCRITWPTGQSTFCFPMEDMMTDMTETVLAPFAITDGWRRHDEYARLAAAGPIHHIVLPTGEPAW